MTPELKTIADALAKLQNAGASEDAKRTLAMTQALQNISAALTGLVAAAEKSNDERGNTDAASAIAEAIKGLRITAPEVTVTSPTVNVEAPTVNVPANPVELTVQAGENHNHVTVPAPSVTVMRAEWFDKEVLFEARGDMIVRATIKKLVQ
jgi:hypothetical protein